MKRFFLLSLAVIAAANYRDNAGGGEKMLFKTIAFVFILVGVAVAWFVLRERRIEKNRRKFEEDILKRFEEGALQHMRLNVNVADQAEILSFDKKWEYPRRLLKFGKVLGSGAFGIARKAEAKSISRAEKAIIVAVKMVHATHRLHYTTAPIRELKVLVHLGIHLNIVNLLGACTSNISYGELLVIVEFCRFGNLRDYLIHRRDDFIDQIDPVTEEIIDPILETNCVDVGHNRFTTMTNYWDPNPARRPTFERLEEDIGREMDNGIHTYYADMSPWYTELIDETVGTAEASEIDNLTMDPSQLNAVAFSNSREKIELGNVTINKSRDPAYPSTSRNVQSIASGSQSDEIQNSILVY